MEERIGCSMIQWPTIHPIQKDTRSTPTVSLHITQDLTVLRCFPSTHGSEVSNAHPESPYMLGRQGLHYCHSTGLTATVGRDREALPSLRQVNGKSPSSNSSQFCCSLLFGLFRNYAFLLVWKCSKKLQ